MRAGRASDPAAEPKVEDGKMKLSGMGKHCWEVRSGDPLRGTLCGISRSRSAAEAQAREVGGWIDEVSEERLIANGLSPDDPDFAIEDK